MASFGEPSCFDQVCVTGCFFVLKKVAFSRGPRSPPRATTHNLKLAFQLAVLKNTKLPVDPVESFTHSTAAPLQ